MKRAMIMGLGMWIGVSLGWANDPRPAKDVSTYLENLQLKLDHAAHRSNQPTSSGSSVIGLRGSKQTPLSKQLYWKGKEGRLPVAPEEVKHFRAAIEEARADKKESAVASLKSFLDKYPKSARKGDVEETLLLLTPAPVAVSDPPPVVPQP